MTLDAGMITWTPTPEQLGAHAVAVRVEDGRGGVDVQTFTITVESTNANRPPRIPSTPRLHRLRGRANIATTCRPPTPTATR